MTSIFATGILVRELDQKLHVQVEGRATLVEGLTLRRFAEERIAAGATAIWVDLCRCTYMDSTFVGTLMVLSREIGRRGGELAAVSPSAQCTRVLYRMGLDDFFPLRPVERDGGWTRLETSPQDAGAFKEGTFEAHREPCRDARASSSCPWLARWRKSCRLRSRTAAGTNRAPLPRVSEPPIDRLRHIGIGTLDGGGVTRSQVELVAELHHHADPARRLA